MILSKNLTRIWLIGSLLSLGVDGACYWLGQTSPAPIPDRMGINYIVIFLVSAPMPFVLAALVTLIGIVLALGRGIGKHLRFASDRRPPPRLRRQPTIGIPAPH